MNILSLRKRTMSKRELLNSAYFIVTTWDLSDEKEEDAVNIVPSGVSIVPSG